MGGATRQFFVEVLERSLEILTEARADHLVIGGLAVRSLLGMGLSEKEDIDVLIREQDAERLLDVFAAEGYTTHRRDERWIYKVARPDVTVDLIFRAAEVVTLDEEHLGRAVGRSLDGVSIRAPAPEDMAVMKALFDADDRRGAWYDAVSMLRAFPIDWDYVVARGRATRPRRVAALLLYAADAGVDVPEQVTSSLLDSI